jgi:hypothetical protein
VVSEGTPAGWEVVVASIQSLNSLFTEAMDHREEDRVEIVSLREVVDNLPTVYLPRDVARAKAKAIAWIGAVTVALVLALVLVFHAQGNQRIQDQRTQTAKIEASTRSNLLAGCERSNDQRDTLRQVIDKAVVSTPAPPDLPPDIKALYDQGQARVTALRSELLSLPGVQQVDCAKAFPPSTTPDR